MDSVYLCVCVRVRVCACVYVERGKMNVKCSGSLLLESLEQKKTCGVALVSRID